MVLLAAIATMLVGWFKGINLLILLSFALVAVVILNWWLARRQFRQLSGRRCWTEPIFASSPALWTVEVSNDSMRAASGFNIEDSGPSHHLDWFVDRLPAAQTRRLRARSVFPERGLHRLEPLRAVCLYPFGLARRQTDLSSPNECLVLPRLGQLDIRRFRRWLTQLLRNDARLHRFARPSMIHQDDLHGLRPFRPGDNPRWIHWRTSARRNLKMVREFEEASGMNLVVVLDLRADTTLRRDPVLEEAISLTATICREWCRHHEDYLMLAVAGATPIVHGGHTSHDLSLEMLQSLAVVEGQREVSANALREKLADSLIPAAPVLLIAPRPNEPLRAQLAGVFRHPVVSVTPETARDFYERPRDGLNHESRSSTAPATL